MISQYVGEHWNVQFDSLADMVGWLDRTPRVWGIQESRNGQRTYNWDLNAGYEGALRLARDGWEEGIREVLANISALPTRARPERIYDVAGDFADAPRAAAGDPFCMVRRGNAHKQRPVMTIAVNTIASGGTRANVLAMYGAALVAVIDRLENRGVRVELWGQAAYNWQGNVKGGISWLVKGAGDPLDLSAVAFGIGHPAMMRRLSFAVAERSPKKCESYGYGQCGAISRARFVDIAEDALLVDGVGTSSWRGQARSMGEMIKLAEEQLNEASNKLGHGDIAELEEL